MKEEAVEDNQSSDNQRAAMRTLQRILKAFVVHNRTMNLSAALTVLRAAADEGKSIGEHARLLGLTHPGMSKLIGDLGELNRRRHKPGSDLLETRRSLINGRLREVHLTHKGRALVHTLIHEMGRGLKDI